MKALVIHPQCGNIAFSIAQAQLSLGLDPHLFLYGENPCASPSQRLMLRFIDPGHKREIRVAFNHVLKEAVLPAVALTHPAFVLVLKGERLDGVICSKLQTSGVPVVSWAYDSLSRCPGQSDVMEIAHTSYVMDGADVGSSGGRAQWLPLGYDPTLYRPGDEGLRDIDILFAGSLMKLYRTRRRYLHLLGRSGVARRRRCVLVGSTGTRMGDSLLRPPGGVEWVAARLPEHEMARLVARAKIFVNIHQDDGEKPVNPMFFAAPGAGACLVAESKPHLAHWLIPGRHYIPVDEVSFPDVLEDLLNDPDKRQAVAVHGLAEVRRRHTFESRLKHILKGLDRRSIGEHLGTDQGVADEGERP